jgi:hypothetical protein
MCIFCLSLICRTCWASPIVQKALTSPSFEAIDLLFVVTRDLSFHSTEDDDVVLLECGTM